jgi:hypothetical protein
MRRCALSITHAAGACEHLPLPNVPESVRSAVHGICPHKAQRPALDARAPVDLRNLVERGFCSACGTPLTYRRIESGTIGVTIGSLDDPEAARPIEQGH